MKKLLTSLAILAAATSSAQITLEHTYSDGNASTLYWGMEGYQVFNSVSQVWKHYSPNHQLIRTINIPTIPGHVMYIPPQYYGTGLFNTDSDLEYLAYYYEEGTNNRIIRVYKESGTQLLTKSCDNCSAVVAEVAGDPKLIISISSVSEVYSLGGTWPLQTDVDEPDTRSRFNMYPNPSSEMVSFEITEPGSIELINMHGQVVSSVPTNDVGTITLPVSGMVAGTYLVHVNGQFAERLIIR
jgi:hypothetical protein